MEHAVGAKAGAVAGDRHMPRIAAVEILRQSPCHPGLNLRPESLADVDILTGYPQRHRVLLPRRPRLDAIPHGVRSWPMMIPLEANASLEISGKNGHAFGPCLLRRAVDEGMRRVSRYFAT